MDFSPFWISLRTALVATAFSFIFGLLAAWMVYRLRKGAFLFDALFTLPMVMPPTVAGFFLLLCFGKHSMIGAFLGRFDLSLVFTPAAVVIAGAVMAFPLMYRTVRGAFEQVDPTLLLAARTLGMGEWRIFLRVLCPAARAGIVAGTVLAFARALGEFGATMMLAGNTPGKTQTMSMAVYTAVQAGNNALAFRWSGVIAIFALLSLSAINLANKKGKIS